MTETGKESQPKPEKQVPGQPEKDNETHDKTIADSFPASDPPSSIPNPEDEEDAA